jgi:D-arginine dehydrogenase
MAGVSGMGGMVDEAGMAGASLAAELAPKRSVLVLEMEDHPGHHSTGRSAAMFFESYGNPTVRALTRASRDFFEHPPEGFTEISLMTPRSAIFVADAPRASHCADMIADDSDGVFQQMSRDGALALCPALRPDWVAAAVLDNTGHDLDVSAIHQGYLRLGRRRGGTLVTSASDMTIDRNGGRWRVATRAGTFECRTLVNAAGAWADQVARMAHVSPLGIQPMRRTAMMLPAPEDYDIKGWPLVVDVDEEFYFKPDAGQILLSPANEDPMDPCDVAPDEMDIAIAVDRLETATHLKVRRINRRWAGLRSFAPDRSPVAGFDPRVGDFFWLAGQGGYGIQMAPGLARAAASLLCQEPMPEDIKAEGATAADLSPGRPGLGVGQ